MTETIILTKAFATLFEAAGIDIHGDIRTQLIQTNEKSTLERFIRLFSLMLQMRNSVPNSQTDYLTSPARDTEGRCYHSDVRFGDIVLPENADANGAYNIARKALWMIEELRNSSDTKSFQAITNAKWLEYAQHHE